MFKILSASADCYITNKIIRNSFRATDANTGLAGTLDLFKLAAESTLPASSTTGPYVDGTSDPIELSRILIKFDLEPLRALTASVLDLNNSSFNCQLRMFDVIGGQTLPSNFKMIAYPLSQAFDEGRGRDVFAFEDLDSANYLTASSTGDGATVWFASGANALGFVGQESVDAVTGSEALGDIFSVQTFAQGDEDLAMDITSIVSATLVGLLPDFGIRLSFSGTHETDEKTRFVKRFASRHAIDQRLRPHIFARFNDAIQDNHEDFFFDVSGSLFLNNFVRGHPANLVSGSALTEISGQNSLLLTLISGTYSSSFTASQHTVGSNTITGVYSATFAIPSNDAGLKDQIILAQSATFDEIWGSLDGTVGYITQSKGFEIRAIPRSAFSNKPRVLKLNVENMQGTYRTNQRVRFRVFAQDDSEIVKYTRVPVKEPSVILNRVHYRIRDPFDDVVVIPFDTVYNSTLLSTDSDGMYFDVFMENLAVGKTYTFDFLVDDRGTMQIYDDLGIRFRLEA